MERQLDLNAAGRDALLGYIATLERAVATLQQRVADLEGQLGSSGCKGMPGLKPAAETWSKASGRPRTRRSHGFARRRSRTPTRQVTHAAEQCPSCATRLTGGWVHRRREVIELPVVPVEVVEHLILARRCPMCPCRVVPAVDLGEVVVGRQRLGVRLVSLIATLREEGRLPVQTVRRLLRTVHQVAVTVGTIVAASVHAAAQQRFQTWLLALCDPVARDPTTVQASRCRRIQRHSDELFVFVAHPDVLPSDNNAAERSARPLVTGRMISAGTRSDQGSATKMANASLVGTWQARGLNPFVQCLQLLAAAPQV